jgi:hypothetical protein
MKHNVIVITHDRVRRNIDCVRLRQGEQLLL